MRRPDLLSALAWIGTWMVGGALTSCANEHVAWERLDAARLALAESTTADARAYARAIEAKDALALRLMGALGEAIGTPADQAEGRSGGPAGAIDVCRTQAPRIAAEVAQETGVRIGRTGVRLRNPANTAPAWAAPLLETKPTSPQASRSSDGTLGVILPIRLASMCITCHGPADTLTEDVRAALAKHYPTDQATGFHDGDLRGWFWIEVPAERSMLPSPRFIARRTASY